MTKVQMQTLSINPEPFLPKLVGLALGRTGAWEAVKRQAQVSMLTQNIVIR